MQYSFYQFPALEHLRKNPTEMRSVNIARVFDKQENINELTRILKTESGNCDSIILPAIVGLNQEKCDRSFAKRN